MDHPLLILVAGHVGAFVLAVAAGGLAGSPEAHRLLLGRLCAVGAVYLIAACLWADWALAGARGALAGAALPIGGALLAWGCAAVGRRLASGARRRVDPLPST
jgi:hypothetical protein